MTIAYKFFFPRRSRPAPARATAALIGATIVAAAVWLSAVPAARAQRQSFEGASERQHNKIQEDKMFDLNGDGVIDDHERELAIQYYKQQRFMDADGKPDKAKIRAALARMKVYEVEQRALDDEPDLLAKRAKGKKLSASEEARLRLAAEVRVRRQQEREQLKRDSKTAPQSAAAQKLAKPIIDY